MLAVFPLMLPFVMGTVLPSEQMTAPTTVLLTDAGCLPLYRLTLTTVDRSSALNTSEPQCRTVMGCCKS